MSDQALEALSASLGTRQAEPELDLRSIKEVDEDKDGKPLLPEPEEKPKPRSESELIDELSEDFDRSECKEKPSKPTEKTEESKAAAPAPVS
ncbi:calpastatin, partial [Homo sapiens]